MSEMRPHTTTELLERAAVREVLEARTAVIDGGNLLSRGKHVK